jgi:Fe2+ transport system protein FeoA
MADAKDKNRDTAPVRDIPISLELHKRLVELGWTPPKKAKK